MIRVRFCGENLPPNPVYGVSGSNSGKVYTFDPGLSVSDLYSRGQMTRRSMSGHRSPFDKTMITGFYS